MNALNSQISRGAGALPSGFSVNEAWLRALKATADLGEQSQLTLPNIIDEFAKKSGDAPALISATTCLSYRQLVALSNQYARWALAEGVAVGDVVWFIMQNCPEYIAIWIGITRVGGVVALVNPNLTGPALAHCIDIVAPKHVIADDRGVASHASAVTDAARPHKLWRHGTAAPSAPTINDTIRRFSGQRLKGAERRLVTLSHRALHIYTSGTTGRPKAANISHHRIVMWSRWFAGLMEVGPSDRMYDCLPLYHSVGGIAATGALLSSGGSVVVREKFSAKNFWRDVAETESTLLQYIGELCRYLLNEPPSVKERSHKLRLCCGNGLRADVWENFKERFQIPRILEFYAATEGNFSLYNVEGRIGAIGRVPIFLTHRFPLSLVAVDPIAGEPFRDSNGRCVKVGRNEVGEAIGRIGVAGAGVAGRFEGYANEWETEQKILRNVFEPNDAWFRTGDLMRRDEQGFYYFVDRIGDTFRWKGENVATLEIEETLCRCAGIRDANVYGVKVPRCEGRAGMAALVVDEDFDFSKLQRHIIANLPDYARPVFIRILAEMDVTETFKHKKKNLAEEGYDPEIISDALYYFDRAQAAYVPVEPRIFGLINAGLVRL
jgi:fatty-acyl-CoA synthase